MRFQKNLFLAFAFVAILFQSCQSDSNEPQTPSATFSRNALEYVQLIPEKYFIYRDSATSALDSVVVKKSKLSSHYAPKTVSNDIFTPDIPAHYYEYFELTLTKFNGYIQTVWLKGDAIAMFDPFGDSNKNGPLSLTDYIDNLILISGSFSMGENDHSDLSITVEGTTYQNVVVHKTYSGVAIDHPAYLKTEYYWVKGLGIIKKSIETTGGNRKTYYLVRHN